MGRHDWADEETPAYPAPVPGRLRVLIGRSALIVLVIGALSWISISILFNPPPAGPLQTQDIELPATPGTANDAEKSAAATPSTPEDLGAGTTATSSARTGSAAEKLLIVHVIGAVKTPGVYELVPGSRVKDAVRSAGGLASSAAPENINLAAQITDGQQIRIPRRGEKPVPALAEASSGSIASPGPAAVSPGTGTKEPTAGPLINVNTATSTELQVLPGIGPAMAQRIIDFRQSNGPFKSLAELDAVSGIGPALLGKIRDRVEFK